MAKSCIVVTGAMRISDPPLLLSPLPSKKDVAWCAMRDYRNFWTLQLFPANTFTVKPQRQALVLLFVPCLTSSWNVLLSLQLLPPTTSIGGGGGTCHMSHRIVTYGRRNSSVTFLGGNVQYDSVLEEPNPNNTLEHRSPNGLTKI